MEPQSPTEPAKLFLQTHTLPRRFRADPLDPNTAEQVAFDAGLKALRRRFPNARIG